MAEYNGLSGKSYRTQNAPFAGGGEGDIYDVVGAPSYVVKVYKTDKRTTERERKLSVMVSNKPSMMEQYAWPLDVLYENGQFVGYIMPRINGKEKLRNIYVFDKRKGKPWSLFIAIAKNLSAAVHNVHEIHQVIGDLNPENILVNPNDGMVTLVDTDSYHISDSSRTYRCGVGMPEFVAPELQGIHFPSAPLPTFTPESDRFALAVLIFALLMNGAHPFSCKVISGSSSKFQPIDNMQNGKCAFFPDSRSSNMDIPRYAPDLSSLPDNIQKLFRRAFVAGHSTPSLRPSAEEWYNALEQLEDNLKSCLKDTQHIYYYGAKECPWCKVNEKMHSISQSAFNSSSQSGSNSGSGSQSATAGGQAQQFTPSNYRYTPSSSGSGTRNPQKRYGGWIALGVAVIVLILIIKSCSSGGSSRPQNATDTQQTNSSQQTNNSNYSGNGNNTPSTTQDTYEPIETGSTYNTINVPAIEVKTASINPITPNMTSVASATILSYSGAISYDDQRDSYTFEAPYDGRYRADISGMQSGTAVELYIYDSAGYRLGADTYCTNGEGVTVKDLSAGSTYEVRVVQDTGFSSYSLAIGFQKATTDISNITELTDSVEYTDQRNVYSFVVPIDGRYRFELSNMMSGTATELYVFNSLGETVASDTYCTNGEGVTVKDMKAGEIYDVQIRQDTGFSSYVFTIGHQKETVDISDLTYLTDSVEYTDQRNVYSFTVPMDGRYRFELSGMKNGTAVELYVFNALGETVASDTYCTNGEGVTVKGAVTGEVYDVQIRQDTGLSTYNFTIGQQKETAIVSNNTIVNDSVEYTDQRNVYSFTADHSGDVTITITGMNSGTAVELYVFNDLDETVTSDTYFQNNESLTIKNVSAGIHYEVQVRQDTGTSKYTLTID